MSVFWLAALAMVLLALAAVLWPLLRPREPEATAVDSTALNVQVFRARCAELQAERDAGLIEQAQLEAATAELERELLRDAAPQATVAAAGRGERWAAGALLLTVPLAVLLIYPLVGVGDWRGLSLAAAEASSEQAEEDFATSIARLEQRLASGQGSGEDWWLMARTRLVMREFPAALEAYRQARLQLGDQPQLLADYAEALILVDGERVPPQAQELAQLVLEQQADNPKALWIAGLAARQAGELALAQAHWNRLLAILPPEDRMTQHLATALEELEQVRAVP